MEEPRLISVNKLAEKLVMDLIENKEAYRVNVTKVSDATVIDCGIEAPGGFDAGIAMARTCLGGLGSVSVGVDRYGELEISSVNVYTDHVPIATLASQFAGWKIKTEDYFAMGSGPARALARKPKKLLRLTGYSDESDVAVIVLESGKIPTESAVRLVADACGVGLDKTYVLVAPTGCIAGMTQVSGRVVETGVHRVTDLEYDPKNILSGSGRAPIAPPHPDPSEAMGRSNDAILYGGVVHLFVSSSDDEELVDLASKAVSGASPQHGKPFKEIFDEAGQDFFKIDPGLFAPAKLILTNLRTGFTTEGGKIEEPLLRRSFGA